MILFLFSLENEFMKKIDDPYDNLYTIPFYDKNILLGKYNYRISKDFVVVDETLSIGRKIYLRKEVYNAFKRMAEDARKDGIILKVISGTRDFYEQKVIWERKFKELAKKRKFIDTVSICREILKYTAMPGTSRHHWGTEIDINSTEKDYFESDSGINVFNWLKKNAKKYGFINPYIDLKEQGYNEEKWHWSYAPLSSIFLKNYIELITYEDITGFTGSDKAKTLKVLENYVKNVNIE